MQHLKSVGDKFKVTPESKEVEPVFHNPAISFNEYYEGGNKLFRVNLETKTSGPLAMQLIQKACRAVDGQSSEIALALWCTKQMVPDPSTVNWPVVGLTALPFSSNKCLQYADMTERLNKNNINWDTHFKSYEEIKKNMETEVDAETIKQNEEEYKWARVYSGWYATDKDDCADRTCKMIYNKGEVYPEEVRSTIF